MIILIILKRLLLTLSSLLFLMSTTMMTISLAGSFNSCCWVFSRIFVTLLLLSTSDFLVVLDVNNHDRLTVSDILPSAWNFFFGKTYLEFYLIFVHIWNPISSSLNSSQFGERVSFCLYHPFNFIERCAWWSSQLESEKLGENHENLIINCVTVLLFENTARKSGKSNCDSSFPRSNATIESPLISQNKLYS